MLRSLRFFSSVKNESPAGKSFSIKKTPTVVNYEEMLIRRSDSPKKITDVVFPANVVDIVEAHRSSSSSRLWSSEYHKVMTELAQDIDTKLKR